MSLSSSRPSSRGKSLAVLAGAVVLTLLVGGLGSLATSPQIPTWYAGLNKPQWTPPNWAFPVAWTLLYIAMAVALWRLVVAALPGPDRRTAIVAWWVQLALNAAWSPVFFALHQIGLALIIVVALWFAIAVTIAAAWRCDQIAAWLLVPYLAWVTYATALNGAIFVLN